MRGRPPKLSAEEQAHIRDLYLRKIAPNGKPYSAAMLARAWRVSEGTIARAIANRTAAKEPQCP